VDPIPLFPAVARRAPVALPLERLGEPVAPVELSPPAGVGELNVFEITVNAYAEGFAQGREEGRRAAKEELSIAARHLLAAAEAVGTHRAHALRDAQEEIVALALAIASQVVRQEAEAGRGLARRLAEVGVARLGECERLVVRLHAEDVRSVVDSMSGTHPGLSIVADGAVARGGAVIESEFGRVDARLETQLEEVRLGLAGGGRE
jgi:flagellar assembly protein FliH